MSEKLYPSGIASLLEGFSKQDGVHPTSIPSMFFIRESVTTEPIPRVNEPSFCMILQGEKEVVLGQERFLYGPGDYIVASIDLPVTGQVVKASAESPYLALKFELNASQILEVVKETPNTSERGTPAKRAMFVSEAQPPLLAAVQRLAALLNNPQHISFLAPLLQKEIIYWILQGPHGGAMAQMVAKNHHVSSIREVIHYILHHYDESFSIDQLAQRANISVSSLHRHFKELTAMSPLQFQKQLRLQEARRLLVTESLDIAEAAFRTGYESPSQFSREYSRLFGLPPKVDITRLKETYA